MNFFFSYLPKGTLVFEYDLNVTQAGDSAMASRSCSACTRLNSPRIVRG